jgi:ribosome-associated protein
VRARFRSRYASKLTDEGDVVIASQRFRDQKRNQEDCLDKLRAMLAAIARAPVRRKKSRPTRASVERRKEKKREISQKKERRRWKRED